MGFSALGCGLWRGGVGGRADLHAVGQRRARCLRVFVRQLFCQLCDVQRYFLPARLLHRHRVSVCGDLVRAFFNGLLVSRTGSGDFDRAVGLHGHDPGVGSRRSNPSGRYRLAVLGAGRLRIGGTGRLALASLANRRGAAGLAGASGEYFVRVIGGYDLYRPYALQRALQRAAGAGQ